MPQAPAVSERSNVNEEKTSQQLSVESGVTSDEYLSPMNSICPSPEPKPEEDVNGKRNTSQNNNKQEPDKLDEKKESESLINKEKSSQGEWIFVGVNLALGVVYLCFLCFYHDLLIVPNLKNTH